MNGRRIVQNFTSYVGFESASKDKGDKDKGGGADGRVEEVKPRLLAGELIIGAAHNVVLFSPVSEKQSGKIGSLYVTNYKLSFVTRDQAMGGCGQQNLLLGPYDATLSMVASVHQLSGIDSNESVSKWRRKHLRPGNSVPQKITGLQVHCKNMRVLSFGFEFSLGQGRTIATSLLHHAFPKRHDLLFAYEYKEDYYPTIKGVNMFHVNIDWKREMDRTNCSEENWRISQANDTSNGFYHGAGETLVVPSSVLDYQLSEAARHFRKGRVPVWVWSAPGGAALTRSGELSAGNNGSGDQGSAVHEPESVLLEAVRRSHPAHSALKIMPLTLTALQLHTAHKRLSDVCTPNNLTNFWEQDSHFYMSMENSRWLRYVSESLSLAAIAADHLSRKITVVLQEGDGMDYSAVVSSLTQLLLDPYFRSINGFQSLIQKEWIALGHPFSDRLGHVALEESNKSDSDRDMSPIFLLFLDCCWQLQKQFPSSFEFTECYLTTLWDSAHNQLFDTFLFNSPRERSVAINKCSNLRSVWDWKEQFSEDQIQYFYNPLYSPPIIPTVRPKSILPTTAIRLIGLASPQKAVDKKMLEPSPVHLVPKTAIASLEIWQQCYFRWLPPLHVQGSGNVQFLLHNMRLVKEIHCLQEKLSNIDVKHVNGAKEEETAPVPSSPHPSAVGSFFPFISSAPSSAADPLASLTTNLLEPHQQLDSQSILNAPD